MGKRETIERMMYVMSNKKVQLKRHISSIYGNNTETNILMQNKKFKNSHVGERIIIVANGPSIKNEKLQLLDGENIFTVNQMIRKPEFASLKPLANFWFDPAYFDEDMPEESKCEFKELFQRTCNLTNSIVNFVPLYAHKYLEKNKMAYERVHYIDSSLFFYDGYNDEFDFTKAVPGFQNIVQYAISMAIYMGFKQICLLGVDSTGIITKINSVLDQSIEQCYSYDLGEKGQKYVNSLLDYFSVEEQFAGWTRIFHLYKELYRYCSIRNIELINCSSQTIIEGIPRKSLEKALL